MIPNQTLINKSRKKPALFGLGGEIEQLRLCVNTAVPKFQYGFFLNFAGKYFLVFGIYHYMYKMDHNFQLIQFSKKYNKIFNYFQDGVKTGIHQNYM